MNSVNFWIAVVIAVFLIHTMSKRKSRQPSTSDEQNNSVQFLIYVSYYVACVVLFFLFAVAYVNSNMALDETSLYINDVKNRRVVLPFS
tara:strand:- start:411 stop:677 length:267 start_codon:yes stop_codon:yes gene_type:complete